MRQHGFTFIELMVTCGIMAIIASTGIPALSNMFDNHQSSNSVRQLRQVLMSARSIALNKTTRITVCPIQNKKCNSDWKKPLAVFNDTNNNKTLDDGEKLYLTASNENSHGTWLTRSATMDSVNFNPQGHAFGSATTFLYCPNSNENQFARQVVISFQGRIRSDYYLSSQGTPYASLGSFNCPTSL